MVKYKGLTLFFKIIYIELSRNIKFKLLNLASLASTRRGNAQNQINKKMAVNRSECSQIFVVSKKKMPPDRSSQAE